MLTLLWSAIGANAQVVAIPFVDAQLYRPSFDAPAFAWVDTAQRPDGGLLLGLSTNYTRSLMVHEVADQRSPVLRDLLGADLTAGYGVGPARFGVVLPVVLRATGWAGGETGLADLGAVGRVTVLSSPALDLAIDGRFWFPTTTLHSPVGEHGVSGEIAGVASREFGKLQLAVNGGYRMMPQAIMDGAVLDNALTARVGGSYAVRDTFGFSAETVAQMGLLRPRAPALPVEALLGGYVDPKGPLSVQLSLGRGLTSGVGAPAFRAVSTVRYAPSAKGNVGDRDHDGIGDAKDQCPMEPEDLDGWQDDDGCPEQPTIVVHVYDESGRLIPGARATVVGRDFERLFEMRVVLSVPPGGYTVVAHNPGYFDVIQAFVAQDGPPRAVDVVLRPTRVVDAGDRIEVSGEIFFESGSQAILSESLPLLDEVATLMQATSDVLRLRIEGHTDTRGLSEDNLALSQRRADSVRAYLVSRGVNAGRLVARGYGESQPLVNREDESAHALNRRVVFVVEDRKP